MVRVWAALWLLLALSLTASTGSMSRNVPRWSLGRTGGTISAQSDAVPRTKVLVIVVGLLRSFRETWPVVSQQLQLESPGLDVDIVVASDLGTPCSDKDVRENRCPHEWTRLSHAEMRRDLRATYGTWLRHIEDQSGKHSGGDQRAFEARVLRLLRSHTAGANLRPWSEYSITLALRPDVIFVQPHPMGEHRFLIVDLAQVCAEFPGLRIIGGSQSRPEVFHNRDWDFAWLICAPATVRNWLLLDASPRDSCNASWPGCARTRPRPPPLPRGLTGRWSEWKSGKRDRRSAGVGSKLAGPPARGVPTLTGLASSTKHPHSSTDEAWRHNNACTTKDRSLCDRVLYALVRKLPFGPLPESTMLAHAVRIRTTPAGSLGTSPVPCTMLQVTIALNKKM
mmetsp:Transcript_21853/g.50865  ORF Transcript_21853/g.50865 Transcript_21853/m.50865 type:complete len:395 (+) Transcript_21853:239-1423(+)